MLLFGEKNEENFEGYIPFCLHLNLILDPDSVSFKQVADQASVKDWTRICGLGIRPIKAKFLESK